MSVMILNTLKNQVKRKIDELQILTKIRFGKTVPNVEVTYDLTSVRTAGQAVALPSMNMYQIHLHSAALLKYGNEYIEDTVVHEFAHLVQRQHAPNSQAHGKEWKHVMLTFGKNPNRCHSMDLKSAITTYNQTIKTGTPIKTRTTKTRTTKTYTYVCDCMVHELSGVRHNKVLKGTGSYCCKHCGTTLKQKVR